MAQAELDPVLSEIFVEGIKKEVSDIYIIPNQPVHFQKDGALIRTEFILCSEEIGQFLTITMREEVYRAFCKKKDVDIAWEFSGRRFRINAYFAAKKPAAVFRLLPARIPSLDEVHCTLAMRNMLRQEQGLILVCGRTGSGKTTTIAAFLEEINKTRAAHILTLEDPAEYLFVPKKSVISQRELGTDFRSFAEAVRSALREMPDVLLVGEIRDRETMRAALSAAESGMLVLGTLHTRGAAETMMRIEGFFPAAERDAIKSQTAEVLCGIFAQRLVPKITEGRVCATEVLLSSPAVKNLLRQGKYSQLSSVMMAQRACGMQTMQRALEELHAQRLISREALERLGGNYAI